ncbi:hypothetical protein CRI93_06335 [Longimonas halophila]|uniref:Uncharacterized protein n=2 Tax=Longimonas halophila TaxID=1469170 RepID=A0A2H3P7L4_9BACT|nr:hypothetical protein CRI93_06335 [Longimonas halophila]
MLCLVAAPGYAQEIRATSDEGTHGQTEDVPYIQASDLQHVTVHRESASGESESAESVLGQTPAFAELVSASSLEEIYRLLGSPNATDQADFPRGRSVHTLNYDGATIEYEMYQEGPRGVTSLEMRSSDWGLAIGEEKIYPGMALSELSATLRTTRRSGDTAPFDNPDIDTYIAIPIAEESEDGCQKLEIWGESSLYCTSTMIPKRLK